VVPDAVPPAALPQDALPLVVGPKAVKRRLGEGTGHSTNSVPPHGCAQGLSSRPDPELLTPPLPPLCPPAPVPGTGISPGSDPTPTPPLLSLPVPVPVPVPVPCLPHCPSCGRPDRASWRRASQGLRRAVGPQVRRALPPQAAHGPSSGCGCTPGAASPALWCSSPGALSVPRLDGLSPEPLVHQRRTRSRPAGAVRRR